MKKFLKSDSLFFLAVTLMAAMFEAAGADSLSTRRGNEQFLGKEVVKVIFDPMEETVLSAEISGQVIDIPKKLGESVSSREPIIILDDTEYQATYIKSQGDLERSKKRFQVIKKLFEQDEESLIRLAEAKNEYISAKAEHIFAKKKLSDTSLRSPFDGKVSNVLIKKYEYAERGKPLIEVINDQKLTGKMLLPARFRPKVSLAQDIDLYVPLIKETVRGTITHIGPMIDPTSSTLKVEIEIDNSDQKIVPGMLGLSFWE